MSSITNAKNGTTRPIYTVESVEEMVIEPTLCEHLRLTEQDEIILEGLCRKHDIAESDGRLYAVLKHFHYLADYKKTKTHQTGRVKKTDKVGTKKRAAFKEKLANWACLTNYVVDESYEGWTQVNGEVGTVYFADKTQNPDGKGALPYCYTFEDACKKAKKVGCSSITLCEQGYSLRDGLIPIKVGISKKSTTGKISHPEKSIMSWALDTDIKLPHSRIEPVKDKRVAEKYKMANLMAELKAIKQNKTPEPEPTPEPTPEPEPEPVVETKKPKKKMKMKAKTPEPEPEPEPEDEESSDIELEVLTIQIDGKDYYLNEDSGEIFDNKTQEIVGKSVDGEHTLF